MTQRKMFRRFALSLALAASSITLGAAGSREAQAAGTLIWGMPAETDTLDPHATGGWSTYQVTYQIFEGLVKEDLTKADAPSPPLVPGLATPGISRPTASSTPFTCGPTSNSMTARPSTPKR